MKGEIELRCNSLTVEQPYFPAARVGSHPTCSTYGAESGNGVMNRYTISPPFKKSKKVFDIFPFGQHLFSVGSLSAAVCLVAPCY